MALPPWLEHKELMTFLEQAGVDTSDCINDYQLRSKVASTLSELGHVPDSPDDLGMDGPELQMIDRIRGAMDRLFDEIGRTPKCQKLASVFPNFLAITSPVYPNFNDPSGRSQRAAKVAMKEAMKLLYESGNPRTPRKKPMPSYGLAVLKMVACVCADETSSPQFLFAEGLMDILITTLESCVPGEANDEEIVCWTAYAMADSLANFRTEQFFKAIWPRPFKELLRLMPLVKSSFAKLQLVRILHLGWRFVSAADTGDKWPLDDSQARLIVSHLKSNLSEEISPETLKKWPTMMLNSETLIHYSCTALDTIILLGRSIHAPLVDAVVELGLPEKLLSISKTVKLEMTQFEVLALIGSLSSCMEGNKIDPLPFSDAALTETVLILSRAFKQKRLSRLPLVEKVLRSLQLMVYMPRLCTFLYKALKGTPEFANNIMCLVTNTSADFRTDSVSALALFCTCATTSKDFELAKPYWDPIVTIASQHATGGSDSIAQCVMELAALAAPAWIMQNSPKEPMMAIAHKVPAKVLPQLTPNCRKLIEAFKSFGPCPKISKPAPQDEEKWFQEFTKKMAAANVQSAKAKGVSSCAKCGTPATLHCSRCKSASYCSKECQKAHWPEHKTVCKAQN